MGDARRPALRGRTTARRALGDFEKIADWVEELGKDLPRRTDAELGALTGAYRERLAAGEPRHEVLMEAFATAREAARRALGTRPHRGLLLAGLAMAFENVADLGPEEDGALACLFPAYLAALEGLRPHLVTVDDERAERDATWTGPVHRMLGLRVGLLRPGLDHAGRRSAHRADVVYGGVQELGYARLRDDLGSLGAESVDAARAVAIVNGIGTLLVDGFDTAMFIAGPDEEVLEWNARERALAAQIAALLDEGDHAAGPHGPRLLRPGIRKVRERLGGDALDPEADAVLLAHLHSFLQPDPPPVPAGTDGTPVIDRITVGGFLRGYEALSGVSAGAAAQEALYRRVYALPVVAVPPLHPADGPSGSDSSEYGPSEYGPSGSGVPDADEFERRARHRFVLDEQRRALFDRVDRVDSLVRAPGEPEREGARPEEITEMIGEIVDDHVARLPAAAGHAELEASLTALGRVCPISVTAGDLARRGGRPLSGRRLAARLRAEALAAYDRRERDLGSVVTRDLERHVLRAVTQRWWRRHLAQALCLPAALALLGFDEATSMRLEEEHAEELYHRMLGPLAEEAIGHLFNLEVDTG
ncbi:hypothetical protein GCM10023085_21790 [Actinomadura viridis]|uniref:Preprotein translocase subunit SecA n=1 Tax=Actinomadura viridis TaxID=58110 RepID=A0A931DGV7_9ACTN|nr:hypothetical protein [Actinomadura viridis]MBG6088554.1 preprotein translocase subunit SecA [Actinomadura viridis]